MKFTASHYVLVISINVNMWDIYVTLVYFDNDKGQMYTLLHT